MPRNDRIPEGVRKEINKIAPGKYLDPTTGRVYIDSADMDDAFEQMIDDTAAADRKRDDDRKARRAALPPDHVMESAFTWQVRHAERMMQAQEDTVGWRSRARARQKHLLARKTFKESLGQQLDPEDEEELRALEEAIGNPEQEDENDEPEGTASQG